MTLAPRSWPSSPGLATSTRILLSDAMCVIICHTSGRLSDAAYKSSSHSLHVHAFPQIPARNTPVRRPWPRDFFHLLRLGHFSLAVMLFHRRLHSVIARR